MLRDIQGTGRRFAVEGVVKSVSVDGVVVDIFVIAAIVVAVYDIILASSVIVAAFAFSTGICSLSGDIEASGAISRHADLTQRLFGGVQIDAFVDVKTSLTGNDAVCLSAFITRFTETETRRDASDEQGITQTLKHVMAEFYCSGDNVSEVTGKTRLSAD